ncbi:hypothetical protein [Bacillus gaemokensis]|nr:hypothetical protein [Bacillus gaemokensis]
MSVKAKGEKVILDIQNVFEAQEKLDCKVVEVHGLEGKNLTLEKE